MPEGLSLHSGAGRHRPKLAIISTWDENCGNASYTFALKKQFEQYYDVDILKLDLFLLQRRGGIFSQLGDQYIKDMARRLKEFDYVNLQFEAGLYGGTIKNIRRRVFSLIDAAPNLILTMHRLDMAERSIVDDLYNSVRKFSFSPYFKGRNKNAFALLYRDIILKCKQASIRKNVWIAVHTRREHRLIDEAYSFKNCIDYPLCFLDRETRAAVQANVVPGAVHARYSLPPNARTVGAFGYLSNYKGFDTLIRAISLLPKDWYLLVVGSQHPQSVKPWVNVDPYLKTLVAEIESGGADGDTWMHKRLQNQIRFSGKFEDLDAVRQSSRELLDRVRFIGNVDDDEFTFLLRNVDATVLPYLEVGQSMSGVVALAVEAGARVFCSNNPSFAEVRRYYGRVFSNFDIGNYIEIAQKVQGDTTDYSEQRAAAFEQFNIHNSVNLHRHVFEHGSLPTPQALQQMAKRPMELAQ